MWVGCPGFLYQHDSVSLESTAKQNVEACVCECVGKGANYGVTRVQCAALSTADRTLLTGRAGAKEHGGNPKRANLARQPDHSGLSKCEISLIDLADLQETVFIRRT